MRINQLINELTSKEMKMDHMIPISKTNDFIARHGRHVGNLGGRALQSVLMYNAMSAGQTQGFLRNNCVCCPVSCNAIPARPKGNGDISIRAAPEKYKTQIK